jgi:coenzyme F420-reducing hydrogenase alpha subunit
MTLAKEINEKLDAILSAMDELRELEVEIDDDLEFENKETGQIVTKEIVLNKGQEDIEQIKADLNKITNNGKNVKNIFNNQFYINDMIQDKVIADEIRLNKMEECLAKQNNPENN